MIRTRRFVEQHLWGEDVGIELEAAFGDARVSATVTEAHDPPLLGAENDRVPRKGESYVKAFKPLKLGVLELQKERGPLILQVLRMTGKKAIDVRMVVLIRLN